MTTSIPATMRALRQTSLNGPRPSTWELVYRNQVHVIGLNIGVLIQTAPQIFGEIMRELFALIAAGVLTPGQPTGYELADGQKALAELESRATVGKLAIMP
jgi:NADPH2:quinone reductase